MSMPFGDGNGDAAGSRSFDVRETTPPHKGGLADTGDGIAKYFLNHDTNTPHTQRQGSIWSSLFGVFSSHNTGFGAATARPSVYVPAYSFKPDVVDAALKFTVNHDSKDPYQN